MGLMNPFFLMTCKKFLLSLFLLMGISFLTMTSARAGVLLGKNNVAVIGTIVEGENSISLQSEFGAVEYKKDTLLWYSSAREIDTLLKAAQKARADGFPQAAMALYNLSLSKETSTQSQAKSEMEDLQATLVNRAVANAEASGQNTSMGHLSEASQLPPEEKIVRGNRMIQDGKDFLAKTYSDARSASAGKATGEQMIAEGNKLIAEAQRELAAIKALRDAEEARQRADQERQIEVQKKVEEAMKTIENIPQISEWSPEDKRMNLIAALVVAILVIISIWTITMRDGKN